MTAAETPNSLVDSARAPDTDRRQLGLQAGAQETDVILLIQSRGWVSRVAASAIVPAILAGDAGGRMAYSASPIGRGRPTVPRERKSKR